MSEKFTYEKPALMGYNPKYALAHGSNASYCIDGVMDPNHEYCTDGVNPTEG